MVNWYPNPNFLGINLPNYNGIQNFQIGKLQEWNRAGLGNIPFQLNHLQGKIQKKYLGFFKQFSIW